MQLTEYDQNEIYYQTHCNECELNRKREIDLLCKYHRPKKTGKLSKKELNNIKKYIAKLYGNKALDNMLK